MTNPFNQSRFRNEHELGSAYRVVSEIHSQLDTIHYLVENLKGVRSGNIELKSDEDGKIYWKYVKSEEWILWGDMTEWFAPLVEELQQGQASQSDSINNLQTQLNSLDQKLDADIDVLNTLTVTVQNLADTVQTDRTDLDNLTQALDTLSQALDSLTQQVGQNTQDISTLQGEIQTIQGEIQTLVDADVDSKARLSALEDIVTGFGTRFQDIESRLEALE